MSDIQNGNVNTFTPVEANSPEVDPVVAAFQAGSLIVYPTEAVMGIGCDPDNEAAVNALLEICLLYTSPSPRDRTRSRMPSSA